MRTETYNALRQYSVDRISAMNASLTAWAADPVGIGTTWTQPFSHLDEENVEFLMDRVGGIQLHNDIIAKLDELHGV